MRQSIVSFVVATTAAATTATATTSTAAVVHCGAPGSTSAARAGRICASSCETASQEAVVYRSQRKCVIPHGTAFGVWQYKLFPTYASRIPPVPLSERSAPAPPRRTPPPILRRIRPPRKIATRISLTRLSPCLHTNVPPWSASAICVQTREIEIATATETETAT